MSHGIYFWYACAMIPYFPYDNETWSLELVFCSVLCTYQCFHPERGGGGRDTLGIRLTKITSPGNLTEHFDRDGALETLDWNSGRNYV